MHARDFSGSWSGKLVCDDYSGYEALFDRGVIEAGCMAPARRKLHDLYANHRSEIAEEWLFVESLRAGQGAVAIMSVIQSAKLNDHDPHRYLKDVLERLPTQAASRL